MNWRPATQADIGEILRLSREPMPGPLKLVWGFSALQAPPGCSDLRVFIAEKEGLLLATAMTWALPDGSRYLAGLRFSPAMTGRPGREHWTRGYRDVLEGVDFAWTSIGRDNHTARRLLERGARWLPAYLPRQELTTCFLPLQRGAGQTPEEELRARDLTPLPHRYAALADISGPLHRLARLFRLLPSPGRELKLLAAPRPVSTRGLRGYDGLILVYPAERPPKLPLRHATWHSILYQVHWNPAQPSVPLPHLHAAWL